jgi:hypothetical protein
MMILPSIYDYSNRVNDGKPIWMDLGGWLVFRSSRFAVTLDSFRLVTVEYLRSSLAIYS